MRLLLAVLVLLVFAPVAGAATVSSPDGVTVEVVDAGSEANDLTVVFDRGRQTLTVTDPGAPLVADGARCRGGPNTVECFIRDTLDLRARLGGGDDRFTTAGEAAVEGGEGNDDLRAGEASELSGGPGNDTLRAGGGFVQVEGEEGDDLLIGGPGPDVLDGGEGHDTFRGGPGSDDIAAHDGDGTAGESIGCGGESDAVTSFDPDDVVAASCEGAFVEGVRLTPPALREDRIRVTIGPGSDFENLSGTVRLRVPATGAVLGSGSFRRLGRREFSHNLRVKPTAEGRRYLRQRRALVRVVVTFRGRRGGAFSMLTEAR